MKKRDLGGHKQPAPAGKRLPMTPHMLLFIFYNVVYFIPVFSVYIWGGYSEDGPGSVLSVVSSREMWQITSLYAAGIVSFLLGTKARDLLHRLLGGRVGLTWTPAWSELKVAEYIAIGILIFTFVALKAALIPLGVYHAYAFDSGAMESAVWTASMFTSEAMLLVGVLVLFSRTKHNVAFFLLLSSLNGINLAHGTRVFFIITVMVSIAYVFVRRHLPIWRILVFGPFAFSGVLLASYVIFLIRSSVSRAGAFTAERILSPIVYESVFSQMSLVSLMTNTSRWSAVGHSLNYFGDVFIFTIPRFLLPDKSDMVYHNVYADISPLGGFSGYADGLIYFGLFFPAFYFVLGFIASWLYRKARKNSWWFVLYIYFSADFLFRIMRDGYMIPSKMLINVVEIVCALIVWRPLCRLLLSKNASITNQLSVHGSSVDPSHR